MSDLEVTSGLVIPARELEFAYSRSSGPGGQNVQKVETRVQLRWRLFASEACTRAQKAAIATAAGRRMTTAGDLILTCQMHRERERNRRELRARLRRLIRHALQPRKKRVRTNPPRAAKERRLREKRQRSQRKRDRRPPAGD